MRKLAYRLYCFYRLRSLFSSSSYLSSKLTGTISTLSTPRFGGALRLQRDYLLFSTYTPICNKVMSAFATPKTSRRKASMIEISVATQTRDVTEARPCRMTRSIGTTMSSTQLFDTSSVPQPLEHDSEITTPPKTAKRKKGKEEEEEEEGNNDYLRFTTPSTTPRRSPIGLTTPPKSGLKVKSIDITKSEVVPITPDGSTTSVPKKKKIKHAVPKKTSTTATADNLSKSHRPPVGWKETYTLVQELRQDRTAPCDGEGAEALPEPNMPPKVFRFQTLIALMLSSQTKDAMVGQAMRRLQAHGLTVENLHPDNTSVETLKELIHGVGFHNNKTKYIHQVVQILLERHDGDIPPSAAEMIKELPGVGPKMAYIVESICWDVQSGIGVDTHMHRLFPLVGYVSKSVKNPEQTRQQLEAWLPSEYWKDVNLLWVGFGQEIQQEKPKMLLKALHCSRPYEALKLLLKCGMDIRAEGAKSGLVDEINEILNKREAN
jgi:endonuclease III